MVQNRVHLLLNLNILQNLFLSKMIHSSFLFAFITNLEDSKWRNWLPASAFA